MSDPAPAMNTVAELPAELGGEVTPKRIGPYRIERLLGSGGMGEVFLAEQLEPIRRQVALKVVRAGREVSERILARFALERQLLALMQHPGIAQLYDTGVTEAGRPYFVMEHVDGEPVTTYCDRHQLSLRARLRLFRALCEAVQHAHQKGVIHRDLKPSNVLVASQDGKPVVKVIDFGVAKAIRGHLAVEQMPTQLDVAVGTLGYMSPEQLDRRIAVDLDTRSDVYALGLLLYELLTGLPPFENPTPQGLIEQILRREPAPPSRRVTEDVEHRNKLARRRGTDTANLVRQLEGDLDWIVAKALEKNPEDRYASVSELAADVKRHLDYLPVSAGPPSWSYRARKFVRRNRLAVGVGAALVLLLVAGVVGTSWALLVSRRSQTLAQREAAKASAANEFLRRMLAAAAPGESGRDVRMVDVLDQAAVNLEGQFNSQPEVEAALRSTLGRTYRSLGMVEKALEQSERALRLASGASATGKGERVSLLSERGQALAAAGRFAEAEAVLLEARALSRELEPDDLARFDTELALASVYDDLTRFADAEALIREALQRYGRLQGDGEHWKLEAQSLLALVLLNAGKGEESLVLHRELVPRARRLVGETHPTTLVLTNNLALLLTNQGFPAEAIELLTRLVAEQRRIQGPDHPETLTSRHNLAAALVKVDRLEEAERELRAVLEDRRRVLGPDHASTLFSLRGLAGVLNRSGRPREALALAEDAHRRALATLGAEHEATARAELLVARCRELLAGKVETR